MAVTTVVEKRTLLGLTGNSAILPLPYRDRHFLSAVFYTFVVETRHFFWMKKTFCTNLERTLLGLTRSFIKKNLPSFSKETDIFHLVYSHTFLLKPFFLNEGNLAFISLAKEPHNRFSCFFYLWRSSILFQITYSFTRNMSKSRGRHVIPKHEHIERPAMLLWMVVSRDEHPAGDVVYSDSSHLFHSVLKGLLVIFCMVMVNILFT